ncbi:unnamed protein product [Brassica rapa]|uniref:Uncharacterized protein n=2 Tax=Brassica TaxID=3705 RepID=A0A8D9G8J6_BRACM|nr:unnamed protein product [Brassica napus]CAG7873270.1 unnamed protein product [Brassica rapa]
MAKITICDDGFFRPVMKCDGEKSKRWTTNHEILDMSVQNLNGLVYFTCNFILVHSAYF